MIPKDKIQQIKDATDIVALVSEYMQLTKSGANYVGNCPFHSDKHPSFSVSREKQIGKCFACGEHVDVFSFVMKINGLTYTEAIKHLGERAGIQVIDREQTEEERQREIQRQTTQTALKFAQEYFAERLPQSEDARAYLEQRGITQADVKSFGIGYADTGWTKLKDTALKAGFSEQSLLDSSLLSSNKEKTSTYDLFQNRLMFPFFNLQGHVIGFTGRSLNPDEKQLNQI